MYTRCPDCETIFALRTWQLAQSSGFVHCGRCNKKFDCLKHLYDHWPEPGEAPVEDLQPGSMPVLSQHLPKEANEVASADKINLRLSPAKPSINFRLLWMTVLVVLVGVTLINFVMILKEPTLAEQPTRRAADNTWAVDRGPSVAYSDPNLINLVSRNIHPHPTVKGALVLSATLINRADMRQPYPVLEVTLFDLHKKPVAKRNFLPSEYLDEASNPGMGLSPGVLLPIVLEMNDPGPEAVGFEIQFR